MDQIQLNNGKNKVEEFLRLHFKVLENLLVGKSFEELKIQFSTEFDKFKYSALTKTFSMLSFDEKGNLRGAYPISPKKSLYKISLEGIGSGYAMCAIDSLGIPYLFEKTTTIISQDPVTKQTIQFTIDPKQEDQVIISKVSEKFQELVITNPKGNEIQIGQAIDQADDICPYVGFVGNRKDLTDQHLSVVDALDFATALHYAKQVFSRQKAKKNVEDFLSLILAIQEHSYIPLDHLVDLYIQNNDLLLNTYTQEQIRSMLVNTLIKNGLIESKNPSNTKEIYILTPFGENIRKIFAD